MEHEKRRPVKPRPRLERTYDTLTAWRAVRIIALLALTVMVSAAVLERLVEPKTFTGIGVSLWWAVVTVGTVGYGDYVPHTARGRIVASGTILFSMALIPTVTSIVVAALVSPGPRDRDTREGDRLAALQEQLPPAEQMLADRSAGS